MRLLFYSHSSTIYGAPSSLVNLASGLKQNHPDVSLHIIIPSAGPLADELFRLGIPYTVIPHFKWSYNFTLYKNKSKQSTILGYLWLVKNIATRAFKNLFYFSRHLAFCKQFKPDIIYVNSSTAPMGLLTGIYAGVKVVCHHRETINDPVTGFYLDFGKRISGWFMRKAYLHVFPSEYLKDTYNWLTGRVADLVQFNGVYFRNALKKKADSAIKLPLRFSMIGRISEQKGQSEVIDFLNNIPEDFYSLKIYGAGLPAYVDDLKKKIRRSSITFEGFQERDVIYNSTDFVIVNAKNESFGRVVAEANAFGIPVLVVSSGALAEIVVNELNGVLFDDFNAFKRYFEQAVLTGKIVSEYTSLSQRTRLFFEQKFSIESYSGAIHKALKSL